MRYIEQCLPLLSVLIIFILIIIVGLKRCDVEYAVEHPNADSYISASGEVYLDIRRYDGE